MSVGALSASLEGGPVRCFVDIPVELAGGEPSDRELPRALETAARSPECRREEWDREFEAIEQKDGEPPSARRAWVRDQLGALAHDFAAVQHGVESLKRSSQQALAAVSQNFHSCEAELSTQKQLRAAAEERLEARVRQVEECQASMAQQRHAEASEAFAVMESRVEQLAELLAARHKDQLTVEHGLVGLRGVVEALQPQLESHRKDVEHGAYERRAAAGQLASDCSAHREGLAKELREHRAEHQASLEPLRRLLERERAERALDLGALRAELGGVREHLALSREELPAACAKCKELEDTLVPQLRDCQRIAKKVAAEQTAGQLRRFEASITEISANFEGEKAARTAYTHEVEQMLVVTRNRFRGLLGEQAEAARQAREALGAALLRQLQREASERSAQQEDLRDLLLGQKGVLDARIDDLERSIAGRAEGRRQPEPAGEAPWEARAAELSRQIHEVRSSIADRLSEERAALSAERAALSEDRSAHEASVDALEEQVVCLNSLFQDVGKRYMATHLGRKGAGPPRHATLDAASLSGQLSGPLTPQTSTAEDSSSDCMSSWVPVTITPRVSLTSKHSAGDTPPGAAAIAVKEVRFGAPELPPHKQGLLARVLGQGRVELALDPEAPSAQVRLRDPIEFAPVRHGDAPVASFLREGSAMDTLGDVAELLSIYDTAAVLIEGHTATPPEDMDRWAYDLALGRAEFVKAAIASFGVALGRLKTAALPGKFGSNGHGVVLVITSFSPAT